MKKEERLATGTLINRYSHLKEVENVGELTRGIRYGNNNIDIRKYQVLCGLLAEYNDAHGTHASLKDHSWPIYCVELKATCPNLGMFDYPGSSGYLKSSQAIKIAILTGEAADGPEDAPYTGLHFKSASNVSIPTLKKSRIMIAKKPKKSKRFTRAQAMNALNFETVPAAPHDCMCKDCKALEALANTSRVLDKLVK